MDCLDGMKLLDNESIDAIICDLPYGVLHRDNPHAQWDRVIPFAPLWEQYERVIKPNGAIILFAQGMFTAQLMTSNPRLWRYNLVWDKCRKTGFLNANRMPMRQHEDICVFYKKQPLYHPQMVKCLPHQKNHSRGTKENPTNRCYGRFNNLLTVITDEKFPGSIIRYRKEHESTVYHPTQKPVALIRYLIRTYTNLGGAILDSCMGSGTTAVAAIRENRNFVGFELNREYFDIADRRIRQEQQQLSLSLDFDDTVSYAPILS